MTPPQIRKKEPKLFISVDTDPDEPSSVSVIPDTPSELELNFSVLDSPGVVPYSTESSEPELTPEPPPVVLLRSRPKPDRRAKDKSKTPFNEIDQYNAARDEGLNDDENLVDLNADDLLQKQKDAMRRELRKHITSIRTKEKKERQARRSRRSSEDENVAFTNDLSDIGATAEPETMDNVLNEMQARGQTLDSEFNAATEPRPRSSSSDSSGRHHSHREGRKHRERRRKKDGRLDESTSSGSSSNPRRRLHSRRSNSPDANVVVANDGSLNEFASLEPIDELSGSLV